MWYISIYISSWDFLCMFPHLSRLPSMLTAHAGHGSVLFVIISIETSIGIVCGCLPGCKPLFGRIWPSIFAPSGSTNKKSSYALSNRNNKPPSKSADGQSFPFQIVKDQDFEISHGGGSCGSKLGSSSTSKARGRKNAELDEVSLDSGEWIMMQKGPSVGESQV